MTVEVSPRSARILATMEAFALWRGSARCSPDRSSSEDVFLALTPADAAGEVKACTVGEPSWQLERV